MAGPAGVVMAGETVDLPDGEASWLLRQGSAERVTIAPFSVPAGQIQAVETASVAPPETRRRGRPRGS